MVELGEIRTCFKRVDYDLAGLLHYIQIAGWPRRGAFTYLGSVHAPRLRSPPLAMSVLRG